MHAGAHGFHQFLHFPAANFRNAQLPGALPQHRISRLNDFNFHGIRYFRTQTSAWQALLNLISAFEDIHEESRCKMKL
jgi:hypothetical protein